MFPQYIHNTIDIYFNKPIIYLRNYPLAISFIDCSWYNSANTRL